MTFSGLTNRIAHRFGKCNTLIGLYMTASALARFPIASFVFVSIVLMMECDVGFTDVFSFACFRKTH